MLSLANYYLFVQLMLQYGVHAKAVPPGTRIQPLTAALIPPFLPGPQYAAPSAPRPRRRCRDGWRGPVRGTVMRGREGGGLGAGAPLLMCQQLNKLAL